MARPSRVVCLAGEGRDQERTRIVSAWVDAGQTRRAPTMSGMLPLVANDTSLPAFFASITIWSLLYSLAMFLIGCLILWLIIYTAVRAALSSHRRVQAEDTAFARGIAAQRRN